MGVPRARPFPSRSRNVPPTVLIRERRAHKGAPNPLVRGASDVQAGANVPGQILALVFVARVINRHGDHVTWPFGLVDFDVRVQLEKRSHGGVSLSEADRSRPTYVSTPGCIRMTPGRYYTGARFSIAPRVSERLTQK